MVLPFSIQSTLLRERIKVVKVNLIGGQYYISQRMSKKVKIGLFGVGHLGKIHLKLLQEIEGFDVIGFYDTDEKIRAEVA